MTEVFADTSYYVALLNPADAFHAAALRATDALTGPMVTTEWVLTELGNYLNDPSNRPLFVETLAQLREDRGAHIVHAEHRLFDAGVRLFGQRPDKAWSLTDCISFVGMSERGIRDALTTDRHFEQAQYRCLLRAS